MCVEKTSSGWASGPTLELIHFDSQSVVPSLRPVGALANSEKQLINLLEPVEIPPTASSWDSFAQSVASSNADIVVPTLHGAYSTSKIGPTTSRGVDPFEHFSEIEEIFSVGSIAAPVLLVFACFQEKNLESWRAVAPSSKLILAADEVGGFATVLKRFLLGEIDVNGMIRAPRGKTWFVHEADQ